MSFEVGRLSAALTLEGVPEFHRELDSVGRKLNETGQRGSSFGKNAEAAVRAAAGATTTLVAAAGAYLTILTKQGIAYNSLQQNSRAALSVLLGGAEQANAQMSKLDDFARNSPFSKSVFIQAQQQLIGFGMEAAKVIPTLDAVQQAVAAMGGSNEQISEVVNILAKVQSTSKFTAETLNELGYRGIDAATLIGNAMGKTASQIRDDISKGAIGGAQALEILVGAMNTRFGGAAENVKQQWSGAVDRIKAAQRDLGAHIAEPFVSAQGGGMAVTWGNQVADVLRAIEKQAVPVMGILTRQGMPFFAGLTQALDSARMSVQRWDASKLEVSLDKLAGHAPAIAATAGAVLALGANVGPLGQMLKVLGISANPVVAAFVGLAAASPEVRQALGDLLATGKPLLPVMGELATVLSGALNSALPVAAGGIRLLTSALEPVLRIISAIPAPVLAGAAAFIVMRSNLDLLKPAYHAVSGVVQSFHDQMKLQQHLAGMSTASMTQLGTATVDMAQGGGRELGAFGAAASVAGSRVTGLGVAIKTAFLSNPIGIALTAVTAVIGIWAAANAAAQQKVEEHKQRVAELRVTLNETTGALTEATAAQIDASLADTKAAELAEKIGLSYKDVRESILGNEEATRRINAATEEYLKTQEKEGAANNTAGDKASNAKLQVKQFTEIYEEHRAAVQASVEAKQKAIEEERAFAASMSESARSNQRFNEALQVARDVTQDAETRVRALKQALDELKGGTISAEEAQIRLTRTAESLADGFARTDEAGNSLWRSLLDGSGNFEINSTAAADLAEQMGRARDGMLDAARAASDQALANGDVAGAAAAAKAAGDSYIDTLRQTLAEAGLTTEQIDGLIGKYLDVPAVVSTLLTDNGSISETDQQILALALQIDSVPDRTVTIDDPNSPEVIKRMQELGLKVEKVPGSKQIKISATGQDAVEAILQNLTRARTATIHIAQGLGGAGGITKADGGVVGHSGSRAIDMMSFANGGGFPTGIFAGGPPLIKFAEPETGWEAFISGRKGQEARNAKIAMDALDRLGFPVVPVSSLRGMRAFANGGTIGASAASSTEAPLPMSGPTIQVYGHRGMSVDDIAEAVWQKFERRL